MNRHFDGPSTYFVYCVQMYLEKCEALKTRSTLNKVAQMMNRHLDGPSAYFVYCVSTVVPRKM